MNPRDIPLFRGYEAALGELFERARTLIATPFQYYDLDLTVASPAGGSLLNIAGDFLYIDVDPSNSNGVATMELNVQQDAARAPFFIQPGFAIAAAFKQLKLTWSAQVGKKLRFLYSTGSRVVPANTAAVSIINTLSVQEQGFSYGASFGSTTAQGAGATSVMVAAGVNVNGLILWAIENAVSSLTVSRSAILAKATAPATIIDGDPLLATLVDTGAVNFANPVAPRAIRVAAGKAIHVFCDQGESRAYRQLLYSAL